MRKDLLVYISGPMTPKNGFSIEENTAAGVKIFLQCLKHNIPAFSPHLCGAFPSAWADVPWQTWLEYDLAMVDHCTHVLMMPRWETSQGAMKEHEYAKSHGLPIYYSFEELLQQVIP